MLGIHPQNIVIPNLSSHSFGLTLPLPLASVTARFLFLFILLDSSPAIRPFHVLTHLRPPFPTNVSYQKIAVATKNKEEHKSF